MITKQQQLRAAYELYEERKATALSRFGPSKEWLEAKDKAWEDYKSSLKSIDPEQFGS